MLNENEVNCWGRFLAKRKSQISHALITAVNTENHTDLKGEIFFDNILKFKKILENQVPQKSTVVIVITNPIDNLVIYNALLCLNCCVVPMEENIDVEAYVDAIKNTRATHIIVEECNNTLQNNLENINVDINFCSLTSANEIIGTQALVTDDPLQSQKPFPSIIYRSSGSTGSPKNIVLTAKNLKDVINIYAKELDHSNFSSALSVLPLSAVYPMSICLATIFSGKNITFGNLQSTSLARLAEYNNADVVPGVPLLAEKMYETIEQGLLSLNTHVYKIVQTLIKTCFIIRKKTGLNIGRCLFFFVHKKTGPSLKAILSGGANISITILKYMHGLGYTIHEGYGITETGGIITMRKEDLSSLGSVGRTLADSKIKISDDGEILVRSNRLFFGYITKNKVKKQDSKWFASGDLGYFDNKKRLYITGRIKDIIVLKNEKKLLPSELESKLNTIKTVCDFIIIGLFNEGQCGDDIIIVVESKERSIINEIKNILNTLEIPEIEMPSAIFLIDKLPRTLLGKINRSEMRSKIQKSEVERL